MKIVKSVIEQTINTTSICFRLLLRLSKIASNIYAWGVFMGIGRETFGLQQTKMRRILLPK